MIIFLIAFLIIVIIAALYLYYRGKTTMNELSEAKYSLYEEGESRKNLEAEVEALRTRFSEIEQSRNFSHDDFEPVTDIAGINISLQEELQDVERTKQRLIESNIQMQLALEASEKGYVDIKIDEKKVFFSPIFAKLLGYTSDELNHHLWKWQDYIHAEDLLTVKDGASLIIEKKQPSAEFTHRVLTKAGHWKWFLTKIKVVAKDEQRNPLRLLIVVEDVSVRKKAEQEMLNNLAKEQELAEVRSRLVTLVSHEFRTPISTILSSIELIENYGDNLSKEKSDKYFAKIKKSIDYLVSFLNEISLMSKAGTGALTFKPEEIEIISFLEELVEEAKTLHKNHPVIHFNTNRKMFRTKYDKQLLRYIFDNLLTNAIKYTPADKNVFIYSILNPTELFFSITDEGIGIPKEEKKGLFIPFTRGSNVGEIKGSGLGLSIVKKTVEVCHGKITFDSELNKGTCFKVVLPLTSSN